LSQVGYFYGGYCEGCCLLVCDSSVEASMIVVEEKLHRGKTVWYMGKGERMKQTSKYHIFSNPIRTRM